MNNKETLVSSRKLSRREFLKLSGAGLAGATLLGTTGCSGRGGDNEGSAGGEGLVFTSYGGSFQRAQEKAWLRPYSKKTGTEISQDSPTDYAKIQSMVENNKVIWDVVDVGNDFGL
jgi:spermidine/putrescine-binding protein